MSESDRKPNILFILIDDMGWRDLACTGSEFYETPNIDRLAGEGMQFDNAYAACPVCSPTRASIMSGRYPARVGVTHYIGGDDKGKVLCPPYTHHLPLEETSLATALNEGGYQTWHLGKWHLGEEPYWPEKHGFEVNVGGCHFGHPFHGYFAPYNIPTLSDGPDGEYLTDRITDEAIRLLENRNDRPFFMNLWYYTVHTPIQAKEETIEAFRRKRAEMGLDEVAEFEDGEHFPSDHKRDCRIRRRLVQADPVYAAMIKHLDDNVGRILDVLEADGTLDNTLILFTSDNGGLSTAEGAPTCNLPLAEGKGWMYEGGTREPLLVRWPGRVAAGSRCDVPVTSPDFYPTLLEAAGLPARPEQHCDGVSILPLLEQSGTPDREAIYWHFPHYANQGGTPGCSMRMGDYKLMRFFEDDHLELYNLSNDVSEDNNLADAEPERAKRMNEMLSDWLESVSAKMCRPNPEYKPADTPPAT